MNIIIYSKKDVERAIADNKFPPNASVINFYDPHSKHIDYSVINCEVYFFPKARNSVQGS